MSCKPDDIVVTEIVNIITVPSAGGRQEWINNRESYGLSFCAEGQITYIHGGKRYISDRDHAIILPQGVSYMLYGDKKGVFPVINFKCLDTFCDTHIVLPIENPESYITDYEQMRMLSFFDGNRMKILSLFYSMLHRLLSPPMSAMLAPALKYIEMNYQNPDLTNSELAQQCSISEVYFRKLFMEQFKTTPRQFVIDIRINKAKQLLSEGWLKIAAISERCGFSNTYHFCRTFKSHVGVTPTEYMMNNRIFKI